MIAALAVAAAAFPVFAAQARAAIYWSNWATGAIGRANLDATDVSPRFIVGARNPTGVALDGLHVYWTSSGGAAIGRASLDGSQVDQSFIGGLAEGDLQGLAVDAHHIYWTDDLNGSIGRANLDGTGVNQRFLTARSPLAVAVDRKHIYWANASSIGRANLDGTHVNQSFIANLPQPWGVAIDAQHIYWSDFSGNRIRRAKLDGTGIESSFITGASHPTGLTIAGGHIYWTNSGTNTIARANVDGTGVLQSFIQGNRIMAPTAVAVGVPAAAASPVKLEFGRRPVGSYGPPKSVTISNTGTAPLQISAVNVSDGDDQDFLTFYDSCSRSSVPVGSHCEIHVRFGPTAVGVRSAMLTVTSDDPRSPLHIALSGTGANGVVGAPGNPTSLLTCKTATKTVVRTRGGVRHKLRVSVAICIGRLDSRTSRFIPGQAIISRGRVIYARGTSLRTGGGRVRLVLTKLRRMPHGRYTLVLRRRQHRHSIVGRVPVRIG